MSGRRTPSAIHVRIARSRGRSETTARSLPPVAETDLDLFCCLVLIVAGRRPCSAASRGASRRRRRRCGSGGSKPRCVAGPFAWRGWALRDGRTGTAAGPARPRAGTLRGDAEPPRGAAALELSAVPCGGGTAPGGARGGGLAVRRSPMSPNLFVRARESEGRYPVGGVCPGLHTAEV